MAYPSEALATHLDHGCLEALSILSQLVYMNFNPSTVLALCDSGDIEEIKGICKDNLDGQALLHELHRQLFQERLH